MQLIMEIFVRQNTYVLSLLSSTLSFAVVVDIRLFCLIEIMKWLNALNSDDKMAKLQLFGVIVCDDGGKSGCRLAHMCK